MAAEICMEAKSNEAAYEALKILSKDGHLRFSLAYVLLESSRLFFVHHLSQVCGGRLD